jgi:PIF1-like helicase
MANRATLSCVQDMCQTVTQTQAAFGGKVVTLIGDFRQTCPVVPHATRAQIVAVSIRSSHLWPLFTIYRLTQPIQNASDLQYAAMIDAIGDGQQSEVNLDMIKHVRTYDVLIDFVFPPTILPNPLHCLTHAILASTNEQVNRINDSIYQTL